LFNKNNALFKVLKDRWGGVCLFFEALKLPLGVQLLLEKLVDVTGLFSKYIKGFPKTLLFLSSANKVPEVPSMLIAFICGLSCCFFKSVKMVCSVCHQ
jgi:hypothetical protein